MRLMRSPSLAFPGGEGGTVATVDEEIKFAEMMLSSSVTFGATFSAGEGFFLRYSFRERYVYKTDAIYLISFDAIYPPVGECKKEAFCQGQKSLLNS